MHEHDWRLCVEEINDERFAYWECAICGSTKPEDDLGDDHE